MADTFTTTIPDSFFDTGEETVYDDLVIPQFTTTSPESTGLMSKLAIQYLDGESAPVEDYIGKASFDDGQDLIRTEIDAKETSLLQEDLNAIQVDQMQAGDDDFFKYMLDTSIASNDILKRTNIERNASKYITTTILSDENGAAYLSSDDVEADDEQLSAMETYSTVQLMLQQASQELLERWDDEGIIANTSDALGYLLRPLGDRNLFTKVLEAGGQEVTALAGKDFAKMQSKLSTARGADKIALYKSVIDVVLQEENSLRASAAFSHLNNTMDWRDQTSLDIFDTLDTVDAALWGATGAKLGVKAVKGAKAIADLRSAANMAKSMGARKAATDIGVETAERAATGKAAPIVVDEGIDNFLMSGLKKALGKDFIDTAGEVQVQVTRRADELTDILEEGFLPTRLDGDETAKAVADTAEALRTRYGNLSTDAMDVSFQAEGRTQRVTMSIGSGPNRTESFVDAEAASEAASKTYHLEEGTYNIVDNGDGFFITVAKDVSETGLVSKIEDTSLLGKGIPVLSRMLGARSQQLNEASSAALLGQNTASRLQKAFNNSLSTIAKLPSKAKDEFLEAISQAHESERWFDVPSFKQYYQDSFGRSATDKDLLAYSNYILANDTDYWVRNARIRKELVTRGYENITLEGTHVGLGKEVTSVRGDLRTVTIFDEVTGEVKAPGTVTQGMINDLVANERFVLLEIPSGYATKKGIANYIISTRSRIGFKPVPTRVLNYQAGGHRLYDGEHFVKQQRLFRGEGGKPLAGRPKTLYNFESANDARIFTDKANASLEAFNKALASGKAEDVIAATKVIQKNTPLWGGYGRMAEMIEDGAILDSKMEVVRSGKVPSGLTSQGIEEAPELVTDLTDEVLQMMEQHKFWYQEKRGEHLRTIVDVANPRVTDKAPIVDPLGALDRSLSQATKMFAFDDYKARQVDQWLKTYGHFLEKVPGSNLSRFLDSKFSAQANISASEIAKANDWRDAVKRTIGNPTFDEKLVDQGYEAVIDYLDKGGKQKWARHFRDAKSSNPVAAIKGLVFDHFMALDPSQTFVQLSMLPGVVAVGGKNGIKALPSYGLLRMAMINDSPEVLARLAATSEKVGGVGGDTFKALWKDMKQSGVLNVMDTQADIASFGKAGTFYKSNILTKAKFYTDKARHAARVFFNEAERGNKGVAYSIAWLERKDSVGAKAFATVDHQWIAGRAETLAGNMTTASRANYQRGVMSIPTQFQAHPLRVMELLLTKNAGFNSADKKRFLTGLGLTYGAGAVLPFGPEMVEGAKTMYINNFGEEPNELVTRAIKDGLVGATMEYFDSVPNLDISRMQTFGNTTNNFINEALFGRKTFAEVSMGPAGSVGTKYFDDMKNALWMKGLITGQMKFEDVPYHMDDVIGELAKNFAGINRASQAYILYSTGQLRDSRGRTIMEIEDPAVGQIVGTALGMRPVEEGEYYEALQDIKAIEESKDFYAARLVDMVERLNELTVSPDPDPETIETLKRSYNMYYDLMRTSQGDAIQGPFVRDVSDIMLRKLNKLSDATFVDDVTRAWAIMNVKRLENN